MSAFNRGSYLAKSNRTALKRCCAYTAYTVERSFARFAFTPAKGDYVAGELLTGTVTFDEFNVEREGIMLVANIEGNPTDLLEELYVFSKQVPGAVVDLASEGWKLAPLPNVPTDFYDGNYRVSLLIVDLVTGGTIKTLTFDPITVGVATVPLLGGGATASKEYASGEVVTIDFASFKQIPRLADSIQDDLNNSRATIELLPYATLATPPDPQTITTGFNKFTLPNVAKRRTLRVDLKSSAGVTIGFRVITVLEGCCWSIEKTDKTSYKVGEEMVVAFKVGPRDDLYPDYKQVVRFELGGNSLIMPTEAVLGALEQNMPIERKIIVPSAVAGIADQLTMKIAYIGADGDGSYVNSILTHPDRITIAAGPPTLDIVERKDEYAFGETISINPPDLQGLSPDVLGGSFSYTRGARSGGGFIGVVDVDLEELKPFDVSLDVTSGEPFDCLIMFRVELKGYSQGYNTIELARTSVLVK